MQGCNALIERNNIENIDLSLRTSSINNAPSLSINSISSYTPINMMSNFLKKVQILANAF